MATSNRVFGQTATAPPSNNGVCMDGLDPALGSLGELIGLLNQTGDDGKYCVDGTWFESPIARSSAGVKDNGEKLAELLAQLLGEVGGQALGVPVQDPALVGTWYPIRRPDTGEPTGLYVGSYAKDKAQVYGLGVYHKWTVAAEQGPGLQVDVWALVPLLRVGGGQFGPVFTEQGYPITIGVAVEGAVAEGGAASPLVKLETFSFNGVKFSAGLDVAAAAAAVGGGKVEYPPVDVSLVILQLQLPGEDAPKDRSLADLAAISAQEIINTASALFVAALTQVNESAADRARYLMPVLGLSSVVPGLEKPVALPILRWDQLFERAVHGNDPAQPFRQWFRAVASDASLLGAWLTSVAGVLTGTAVTVGGDGTREHPFRVPILDLSKTEPPVGVLFFTASTLVDADSRRRLYPGLSFSSTQLRLGSAPAGLSMQAEVELAEFVLAADNSVSYTGPSSLKFDAGFVLGSTQKDQPLVNADQYRCDTIRAGIQLGIGAKPVPSFQLVKVETPDSQYDAIDLLSPGELAAVAETVIDQQLKKLLGVGGPDKVPFASNAAALLGVITPEVPGGSWPVSTLPPPFTLSQLPQSIQNPVGALGSYYQQILTSTEKVNGRAAFEYVLLELAGLLQDASLGAEITLDGDGTQASPWSATISNAKGRTLPATLTGYVRASGDDVTQLVLGLQLGPELTLGSTRIIPSVGIEFLTLDLPKKGSAARFGGVWASAIQARLDLPDGFQSPPVGGASISLDRATMLAGWSRLDGWGWSLLAAAPKLTIDGQVIELGQDLNFSEQSTLQELVTSGSQTFSKMLVGVLGVALLRTRKRPALALAGLLGLLKGIDKAENFPKGLAWPSIPTLAIDDLRRPQQAIFTQLQNDFSSDENAHAVLSLLAWALNPAAVDLPAVNGSRDFDAPFKVPLGGTNFQGLAWYVEAQKALGLGLGRTDRTTYGQSLAVTVETRLNMVEVSLADGSFAAGFAPSLSFLTTIEKPGGPLLAPTEQGGSLGKIVLGFKASLAGGSLQVSPVVTLLDAALPGEAQQSAITLEDFLKPEFADRLRESFQFLVNRAIQVAVAQVADKPAFKDTYSLLVGLGLALARQTETDPYGINPAGWQALLADPLNFARTQLGRLLADPALRSQFFEYVQARLGIKLPPVPAPALEVLSALGLLGDAESGYPVRLDALLALAERPFQTLSEAFDRLVTDEAARRALVSRLAGNIPPTCFGPFIFQSTGGTKVSLGIDPSKALSIAGVVTLSGTLTLDLADLSLEVSLRAFSPALQLAAVPALSYRPAPGAVPAFTLDLAWGDGTRPAPEALRLFPFEPARFTAQLADLAPAYVLSTLVSVVVESNVLARFPLAQQVFEGLGLAQQEDGRWTMPSLLGLLRDPKGWLLSEGVLGEDGKFDLIAFAALLKKLPAVTASNGLAIAPNANGATVSGLPYNFRIDLGVTDEAQPRAAIALSTGGFSVAGNRGKLEKLSAAVSLGADYQPSVSGLIRVSSNSPNTENNFFVEAGYDRAFALTIGEKPTGDNSDISLQILPFQGWGSLLEQAARKLPAVVLREVTPVLLDKLRAQGSGAKDFADRLSTAGTQLQIADLITRLSAVDPFTAENVERAALEWLRQRLSPEFAATTASAAATLLQGVLPTQVTTDGGLVVYQPSPKLPLKVLVGFDQTQQLAGAWARLDLPETSLLRARVKQAGVGVPLQGDANPVFSFGVELTVPLDGSVGPQLSMGYEPGKGLGLTFDPLGDAEGGAASDLQRQLLPAFFPARPHDPEGSTTGDRVEAWLFEVLKNVLPRYVSVVTLNQATVHKWLESPLMSAEGAPTPGLVLTASQLLKKDDASGRYVLNSIDALKNLTVEQFLGGFLRALLKAQIKVLSFGKDGTGQIWVGPRPGGGSSYGLRLVAPDFAVPKVSNVVLQLGANDQAWIAKAGGDTGGLDPGISVYVPLSNDQVPVPDFSSLEVNLVNVGLDFVGSNGRPLVNTSRFKLGAVSPRGLLTVKMRPGASPQVGFGGDVTLRDIGLSLAPNTLTEGSTESNPIARNLLGSGDDASQQNPATNPTFSVEAAYAGKLWVDLRGNDSTGTQVVIPVQRSFGPLYVGEIGVGWQDAARLLQILFSGRVALAGLRADVNGLTVGIPVTKPTDFESYTLDLKGLDVSFQGGAVSISGGLLKTTTPYLSYTGAALIKATSFSLIAVGSYAEYPVVPDSDQTVPSLFIFGALNAPLGGLPAFFITGVAAGFSYNRGIILPEIGEVQNFPLVSGVINGTFTPDDQPGDALAVLAEKVPPMVGQYWLAAGLKFTSFRLLECFALLFVGFGREFEFTLLGLASAALPKGLGKGQGLAYIELGLKVSIKPSDGVFSAEAQLTPNSYVISKDCKLTGGFAFYLWFKNRDTDDEQITAGDFVITLGGYHPAFKKPKHYPEVPRLGFNWLIDAGAVGLVSVSGGAYFALTPTAIMAGGYLHVLFVAGPLRAWLDAVVNFLVAWKPFYYNIQVEISVGVAFETEILGVTITLKVELGASLVLMGPPTHGHVRVTWYIISFTIPFGDGPKADSQTLDWGAFEEEFLPKPSTPEQPQPALRADVRALNAAALSPVVRSDAPVQQIVKLRVEDGLLDERANGWLVRPYPFTLIVETAIPAVQLTFENSATSYQGADVGVRPMGLNTSLDAKLSVQIADSAGNNVNLKERGFGLNPAQQGVPAALWSKDALDREHAPDPTKMIIPGGLTGAFLAGTQYVGHSSVDAFPADNLKYDIGNPILIPFARTPNDPPAGRYCDAQQQTALAILRATIMKRDPAPLAGPPAPCPVIQGSVVDKRNAILRALQASAIEAPLDPDLSVTAAAADLVMQAPPVLARVGIYQTGTVAAGRVVGPAAAMRVEAAEAPAISLTLKLGVLRRYRIGAAPASPAYAGLLPHSQAVSARWVDARRTVERGALRAFAAADAKAADTGRSRATIQPGTLVMWDVDERATHRLDVEGELPSRAICFDRHGALLSMRVAGSSDATTLPKATAALAVQGAPPTPRERAIGWQLDTELTRLNEYYGVGEHCVVRTQNITRLRHKGHHVARGQVNASELLQNNFVRTRGGGLRPGQVETVFPGGRASFAVVVATKEGGSGASGLYVAASQGEAPGLLSRAALEPAAQFASGPATVLVYRTPQSETAEHLTIVVQPLDASVSLLGVYALDIGAEEVEHEWPALTLEQTALDLDDEASAPAQVTLSRVQSEEG